MFSSGSSFDPFDHQYFNQTNSESSHIQNPSSTEQNHSSPFLYLQPTSFGFDHSDLLAGEFFSLEQEDEILGSNITLEAEIQENPASSDDEGGNEEKEKRSKGNAAKQPVSRKRSRKNDRHSKILTAQGPRDRRMRLSLPIARKFFDLQDMLGFDKASKTIEWLFAKSRDAIKEFTDSLAKIKSSSTATGGKRAASPSESEVGSGVKLTLDNGGNRDAATEGESFVNVRREKRRSRFHKQVFNPFGRESREKARARARERTREKNKMKGLDNLPELSSQANPNKLDHLSSLENGENLGSASQDSAPPHLDMTQEEESSAYMLQNQMDTINLVDRCMGTTGEPRSSTFDSSHAFPVRISGTLEEEFAEICVNWEMTNPRVHHKHSAMPKTKPGTGSLHAQNPNAILMATPFTQEKSSSSTMANTSISQELAKDQDQEQNASSVFMNISNPNEQNPISALVTPAAAYSQFKENQFFYNAIFPHNNGSLY